MIVAFDTSVLVAAFFTKHAMHLRASVWLTAAQDGTIDGVMSLHAVAELWGKLTSLKHLDPLSARDAAEVIDRLKRVIVAAEMDDAIYADAIERCIVMNQNGPALFDALHLATARYRDAEVLVTFNEKDFNRLWRPGDPHIVVPPDPPAVVASLDATRRLDGERGTGVDGEKALATPMVGRKLDLDA